MAYQAPRVVRQQAKLLASNKASGRRQQLPFTTNTAAPAPVFATVPTTTAPTTTAAATTPRGGASRRFLRLVPSIKPAGKFRQLTRPFAKPTAATATAATATAATTAALTAAAAVAPTAATASSKRGFCSEADTPRDDSEGFSEQVLGSHLEKLLEAGIQREEAEASMRWLVRHAARTGADYEDRKKILEAAVQRRARREPVQYIIGSWPFHPLPKDLLLRPPVLIPRPETEELVDIIVEDYKNESTQRHLRILEFGSGTGAISLALLHSLPGATAVAVEPSAEAFELTQENARRLGLEHRLTTLRLTAEAWASHPEHVADKFDIVVSNPPYIPSKLVETLEPEVRDFESRQALDGGERGLDVIMEVLEASLVAGSKGTKVYLEVHESHPALFEAVAGGAMDIDADGRLSVLSAEGHLRLVKTMDDFLGRPRFVVLELV